MCFVSQMQLTPKTKEDLNLRRRKNAGLQKKRNTRRLIIKGFSILGVILLPDQRILFQYQLILTPKIAILVIFRRRRCLRIEGTEKDRRLRTRNS